MASTNSHLTKSPLSFSASSRDLIEPYTPRDVELTANGKPRPFVTLTYAQSLDSSLSLASGVRTALSGPETKAMTHYLRSVHDAILVGVGTAVADDPALNCRLEDAIGDSAKQPQPLVLDPSRRWRAERSRCFEQASDGNGKIPWTLTKTRPETHSTYGVFIEIPIMPEADGRESFSWPTILAELYARGIRSVMVEGGGTVINSLLSAVNDKLVDSVIITVAPIWLGEGGVLVNPTRASRSSPACRLKDVKWHQFGEDAVLCGRPAVGQTN